MKQNLRSFDDYKQMDKNQQKGDVSAKGIKRIYPVGEPTKIHLLKKVER